MGLCRRWRGKGVPRLRLRQAAADAALDVRETHTGERDGDGLREGAHKESPTCSDGPGRACGQSRRELPSPVTRDGQTERQRLRENEAKMEKEEEGEEGAGENRDVTWAGRRLGADTRV